MISSDFIVYQRQYIGNTVLLLERDFLYRDALECRIKDKVLQPGCLALKVEEDVGIIDYLKIVVHIQRIPAILYPERLAEV